MRQILLPMTHDSGAVAEHFPLPLVAAPELPPGFKRSWGNWITSTNKIVAKIQHLGVQPPKILEDVSGFVDSVILDFSGTQSKTFRDQLDGGIRALDLRIGRAEKGFCTYHGFVAISVNDMLDDLHDFLSNTHGELVVAHIGGVIANPPSPSASGPPPDVTELLSQIQRRFKNDDFLYPYPGSLEAFANMPLGKITGSNSAKKSKLMFTFNNGDSSNPNSYQGGIPGIWNNNPYQCKTSSCDDYCTSSAGLVSRGLVYNPPTADGEEEDIIAEIAFRLKNAVASVQYLKDHPAELEAVCSIIDGVAMEVNNGVQPAEKWWHSIEQYAVEIENPGLSEYLSKRDNVTFNEINVDFFEMSSLVQEAMARSGAS